MKKYIGYALTALVSVLAMTGCGKNDSNTNPAVYGAYGYSNCAGCVGNTQLMAQAVSSNPYYGETMQLQILTQTAQSFQTAYASGYTQIAAQGTLVLGPTVAQCGLIPGTYSVQTYQAPAVMQGVNVQNMSLIGTGPMQIQVQFAQMFFTSPTEFSANGTIVGQNGGHCSFSYL